MNAIRNACYLSIIALLGLLTACDGISGTKQWFQCNGERLNESQEISQAEEWVLDHPDDPRIPEMLKAIKIRKGIKQ